MKTILKTLIPYLIAAVAVIAIAKVSGVARWLFDYTPISAEQQHTIDSLRVANAILDTAATNERARSDSIRRVARARARRDSIASARSLDSLNALIPDTATMVPRPIHNAIVAQKDFVILGLRRDLSTADSLRARSDSIATAFQSLNRSLQFQINDLAKKANPNLIRRLKIAAPFVASTWGACKLKLIDCG